MNNINIGDTVSFSLWDRVRRAGKVTDIDNEGKCEIRYRDQSRTPSGGFAAYLPMDRLTLVRKGTSRDIQVIIKDSGSSKPKRQRYNPAKRRYAKKYPTDTSKLGPRKGRFVRKPKPTFAKVMAAKYGDAAPSLNTETQRDPSREIQHARGVRNKTVCGAPNGSLDWSVANFIEQTENPGRRGQLCGRCKAILMRSHRTHTRQCMERAKRGNEVPVKCTCKPSKALRKRRTQKNPVSRDFSDDVRHLSLTALGRLLRQYHGRGDEAKCHIIEREIDRRTKGFRRGSR